MVPLANWNNPTKRRLETVRAAHERDPEPLLGLLEAYLRLKGSRRALSSPRTLRNYHLAARDFLAWAWSESQSLEILRVSPDDLDRYIVSLQTHGGHLAGARGRPLKPGSVATYVAGVRALYRALEWAGVVHPPQVRSPRDPTPPEERRPALPETLYKRLLERLSGSTPELLRDRVIVRLMGEAGLRISEVVGLSVGDIHLPERLLQIRSGKGGKQRTIPIGKSLVRELEAWLQLRSQRAAPGEDALFVNLGGRKASGRRMQAKHLRKILNQAYRDLGFPAHYHGAHVLRHTAGTRFYRASHDLHVTARLLGHASVATSAIYAKLDTERLFEIVDGLDGGEG